MPCRMQDTGSLRGQTPRIVFGSRQWMGLGFLRATGRTGSLSRTRITRLRPKKGENMATIRVLIADDYNAIRTALTRALHVEPQIEVVGEASDGYSAVLLAGKLKPDIVLMDINMPGLDGIEATRRIVRQNPDVKVIGLSVHCFEFYARRMLEAGARAYLLKDCDIEELLEVIEVVREGQTYVSPEVVGFGTGRSRLKLPRRLPRVGWKPAS
jgi:CheY-like chemotaxis protein